MDSNKVLSVDEANQVNDLLKKVKSSQAATYVQQPNSQIFFKQPITAVRQEVQKILHQQQKI